MSGDRPSYDELRERLARAEAALDSLRRGEVDLVIGTAEPLVLRFKSLAEENERLIREWQTTFDSMGDAVWILDPEGRVLRSNRAAERIFQRPIAEMIGKHCWEIVHGTHEPVPECPVLRMKKSLKRERMELPVGESWFEVMVDPILDENNRLTGAVHVVSDITGRKRAEEKLQESAGLIMIAGEMAKLGGWSVDLANNRCTWSDETAAIHERPAGYAPLVEEGINYYAPEWREKIAQVFTACAQNGIPYDEEMEIITAGGRRVWVRTIGKPVKDEAGKIIKVQGAFQDITEQKRTEEELRCRLKELKLWHAVTMDREDRVLELKKEVNDLLKEAGRPVKYAGS
jgi:PAS domain S-box-containing protein